MKSLLKFGIHNGNLVSIESVASGLKCKCFCPKCNATLIARKGSVREHHFAHYNTDECEYARESALHLLAKNILCAKKQVYIPKQRNDNRYPGETVCFDEVIPESHQFDGFIPDVLMIKGNNIIAVEILVTHTIDEEKEKRIYDSKINTIEIDLSSFIDQYDDTIVQNALLSGQFTKWIYNSTLDQQNQEYQIANLTDFLELDQNGRCYCLLQRKRVDMLYNSKLSCHECWYYDHHVQNYDYNKFRPCHFRLIDLTKEKIERITNVRRYNGIIVSIDVETSEGSQHWEGQTYQPLNRIFVKDSQPSDRQPVSPISKRTSHFELDCRDLGDSIFELWSSEYKYIIVEDMYSEKKMIIYGIYGNIQRMSNSTSSPIICRYTWKDNYGKYKYSEKRYPISNADACKKKWRLIYSATRSENTGQQLSAILIKSNFSTLVLYCQKNNKYYYFQISCHNPPIWSAYDFDPKSGEIGETKQNEKIFPYANIPCWKLENKNM